MTDEHYATYIRASTDDQEDQHQREDIEEWLGERGLSLADVELYAESVSGADEAREEFQRLINVIEGGHLDHVVVWEISRIARRGFLAQKFFDACEDNDAVIHVVNGSVRKVEPDGHGRMVADVIAAVAAEERRQLIRRTRAGLRRARSEGKWLGQVPTGFVRTNDGYLRPNLSPNYDNGETGYLDVVEALEAIEDGASYREMGRETPNVSRQTLMNVHKNDERRRWYLDGEAEDDAIREALDSVSAKCLRSDF